MMNRLGMRCRLFGAGVLLIALLLTGCSKGSGSGNRTAVEPLPPLDPDGETRSLSYDELIEQFGDTPTPKRPLRIGILLKFLGNPYWRLLAKGLQEEARIRGVAVEIRAAAMEVEPESQILILKEMMSKDFDAFILAPQVDEGLAPLVAEIEQSGRPVLILNEIIDQARTWVGPSQYKTGVAAARFFLRSCPEGSQVAVIEGLPSAYASRQRTLGFKETLKGEGIEIVASVPCNWDPKCAMKQMADLLERYPALKGVYCANDVMAMGAIEAINSKGRSRSVLVVGTDGIAPAVQALERGELAATIDTFPEKTGQIAMVVMLHLLEGRILPRVVFTPQQLLTRQPSASGVQE